VQEEGSKMSEGYTRLFYAVTAVGYFLIDLGTASLFKWLKK
jgi:hypothetical protein